MKNLISLIFLLLSGSMFGQPVPMTEASVQAHVYHFTQQEGQLSGAGADVLRRYLYEAQFFLFGEYHGSHQLTTLCTTLLAEANRAGYQHFAVEVGPNSAKILTRLAKDPDRVTERLYAFNSKYYLPVDDDIPIPFFAGVEDAVLLATASRLGYQLWGLDQEYFTSVFFLFDEMVDLSGKDPVLVSLRKKVEPKLRYFFQQDAQQKRYPLYDSLLYSPVVREFMQKAAANNQKCAHIVKGLEVSWDIYERNRRYSRSSHLKRIKYMRDNFLQNYRLQEMAGPKVFVKMGGLHTSKGIQLGAYDIGDLTGQLAQRNGTQSISTGATYRFEENEDGSIKDHWAERSDQFVSFSFRMFGRKDEWTVVDLKTLKTKVAAGELLLPDDYTYHRVRADLENYDLLFIPPVDKETAPNYEK